MARSGFYDELPAGANRELDQQLRTAEDDDKLTDPVEEDLRATKSPLPPGGLPTPKASSRRRPTAEDLDEQVSGLRRELLEAVKEETATQKGHVDHLAQEISKFTMLLQFTEVKHKADINTVQAEVDKLRLDLTKVQKHLSNPPSANEIKKQ